LCSLPKLHTTFVGTPVTLGIPRYYRCNPTWIIEGVALTGLQVQWSHRVAFTKDTVLNVTMGTEWSLSLTLSTISALLKDGASVSHASPQMIPAIVVLEQRFDGQTGGVPACRVSTSVCLSAGLAAVRGSFWNKGRAG
jgi:hypothetical protein